MFTKTFHSSLEAYKRTLPNSYFTTYPKLNDINNTQKKIHADGYGYFW